MNYLAQLNFYKHDDVYVTSCEVIFIILHTGDDPKLRRLLL